MKIFRPLSQPRDHAAQPGLTAQSRRRTSHSQERNIGPRSQSADTDRGLYTVEPQRQTRGDACRLGRYSRIYPLCSALATCLLAPRNDTLSRDSPRRNYKTSRQTSRSPRPSPLNGAPESLHTTPHRSTNQARPSIASLPITGAHPPSLKATMGTPRPDVRDRPEHALEYT